MATLQKFKLLAMHCAVAPSPTRSPGTSPVVQLRRRKTLRMLLNRSSSSNSSRRWPRREVSRDSRSIVADPVEKSKTLISHTLKDLFVSSPPLDEDDFKVSEKKKRMMEVNGERLASVLNRGGHAGSPRPISGGFRYRLLRRAWRPVLVTIPE